MNKRWYDKYPELATYLESFNGGAQDKGDKVLKGIIRLISEDKPNMLTDYVSDFPWQDRRRRLYDRNPSLWLVFSGLEYADENLIIKVNEYLKEIVNN